MTTSVSRVAAGLLFGAALLLLLSGCRRSELRFSGATMGTFYSVKVIPSRAHLKEKSRSEWERLLARALTQELEELNRIFSIYRPDSEISAINQDRSGETRPLSPPLLEVLLLAKEIHALSGGAFDISVGPLVNLYGFGPKKPAKDRSPSAAELAAARAGVGLDLLRLDPSTSTVQKEHPELFLDLGAIAKGYGVDMLGALLERHRFADYMVEIGGEVLARGRNSRGVPWSIGIEKPLDQERSLQRVIHLQDQAIATSGDYRSYFIKEGQRLSHTIDPRSGRPVEHNLAAVSVIADRCVLADAWATALMVLGPQAAWELAQERELAVLLIERQADGSFSSRQTDSFPD